VIVAETAREQTRARYPDEEGYVERDGVQIFWERYGQGEPTVLLMPTWEIVHSRFWKCQIPYLARHGRVVTFDPPGNGRSGRPTQYDAYTPKAFAEDAVAVLEAADVECPVVVGWCDLGESLIFAAEHPERVAGLVLIGTPVPDGPGPVEYEEYPFEDELDTDEAGPRKTAITGCVTGGGTSNGSSPSASPSRTRRSRSKTASGGGSRPTRRRSWPASVAGTPRQSTTRLRSSSASASAALRS
jgi:pimeloyl-ACP methyl ester carboxylesterase